MTPASSLTFTISTMTSMTPMPSEIAARDPEETSNQPPCFELEGDSRPCDKKRLQLATWYCNPAGEISSSHDALYEKTEMIANINFGTSEVPLALELE